VIDAKNGKQPMISFDKKILTIFNGTIYNFREIKKYLEKKSITFKTNSDTEVLVNAFSFWGEKCFNYFDGMWAAAFYDFKLNKITLSRDYLGQKPLLYYKNNNKLVFSSQIKGIFKYKNNFELSKINLNLYYQFSHIPAPYTAYKNIYQLIPGEIITISKKINKKIYWDIAKGPNYNIFFKPKRKEDIEANFDSNLKNYLISDKKTIIALSSGKDSQILNESLKKIEKLEKPSTITIGFEDRTFDESKYIKKNNKSSKIKILNKYTILKVFDILKKKLIFFNGDGSILPTYFLFNEIKKNTNVSLTGDGGDEVFFGYITFRAFYTLSILKKIIPIFFLKIIRNIFSNIYYSNEYLNIRKKIYLFFKHLNKELFLVNSYWLNDFEENEINKITNTKKDHKLLKKIKKIFEKNSILKFVQIYYFKFYLPMILEKVDYASMSNSVENRAPFLNKDLINFAINYDQKKNFSLFKEKKLMISIFKDRIKKKYRKIEKHGFAFQKGIILKNQKFIFNGANLKVYYDKYQKWNKYTNKIKKSNKCKYYIIKESYNQVCKGCGSTSCSSHFCRGAYSDEYWYSSQYVGENIQQATEAYFKLLQ
jgi:asparagine synthase (glutamine-hydrolysing)